MNEPTWLDAPFFTVLEDFASIQSYFIGQAMVIARILLLLNIGLIAIKYAIKGSDLKEPVIKLVMAWLFFIVTINMYPHIIKGINEIVFQWSYSSTYDKIAAMIKNCNEFWVKKEQRQNRPRLFRHHFGDTRSAR